MPATRALIALLFKTEKLIQGAYQLRDMSHFEKFLTLVLDIALELCLII